MNRFFFWFTYWMATLYLKLFRGLKIYGRENIPKKGPVIVAGNHVSMIDPVVLATAINRITRFMAKKELFKFPPFGWYLKKIGCFPVERGKGDMEAMRTSLKILRNGEALGIFPEGTRNTSGKIGKAQLGVVMLALKVKAPIIPCGISNVLGGKRPITVRIGQPIYLNNYYDQKLNKKEKTEIALLVMKEISQLLTENTLLSKKKL